MKKLLIGSLIVFIHQFSLGQEERLDSLSNLPFEVQEAYFNKQYIDSIEDVIRARAYLKRAVREADTVKIANGYYYLSDVSKIEDALLYCDTIIRLTENLRKHETYPSLAYLQRGAKKFNLGMYEEALSDYLLALEYANESGNTLFSLAIRGNIGTLKQMTGEHDEALQIYRDYVEFVQNNDIIDREFYLTRGLYSLATAYVTNNKTDSASITINRGYAIAEQAKDSVMLAYYTYISGVNWYEMGDYATSIDSLNAGKLFYSEGSLSAMTNLYLGKSHLALNNKEKAIGFLVAVDTYIQSTTSITPELLEAYKPIIAHYKLEGDLEERLKYINRYLTADSIIDAKYKSLERKITNNYEIPNILTERNQLIDRLRDKNQLSSQYIVLLTSLSVVFLLLLLYFYQKSRINKKRFDSIMGEIENARTKETTRVQDKTSLDKQLLSDDLTQEILEKLKQFEEKNKFIKSYTLPSLAKELKTNGTYLSKVINTHKGSNFANYLNELRIKYAINKLNYDKRFRIYTIEAIAKDSGFNTAQSFSKAFQKETGLKPSYFINQLNSRNK